MKTLNAKLEDRLQVEGWDIIRVHMDDLECWADEVWELKSRWSPADVKAFVTFLVDPQWEGNRRKGQAVWAVACSATFPRERMDAAFVDTLSLKGSNEEIEDFVDALEGFRNVPGNV